MLDMSVWKADPGAVQLAEDQVHVWCAPLDRPNEGQLFDILAVDERARATRYRFERDRRRFVVGRGLLRVLLGRYLEIAPERIDIRYESAGRPYVAAPEPIQFSLARPQRSCSTPLQRIAQLGSASSKSAISPTR